MCLFSKLSLLVEIQLGLLKNEFELYYQPVVCLKTARVIGFEALVRWNHPYLGLVSPDKFIPFIETKNWLACMFSRYILKNAAIQAKKWNCNDNLYIAVNVPIAHLASASFTEYLDSLIVEYSLPYSALVLEITESSYGDFSPIIRSLASLSTLGTKNHLDDFLTGFSSFERLIRLEKYLSAVKISELFAANLIENSDIVALLVSVSHSRNLKVIAEGIETPLQLETITQLNVDSAQGWLWSKALPANDAWQWANDYNLATTLIT